MQHFILIKLTLFLLGFNQAFGESCPILNVTYENFFASSLGNIYFLYQYKEVDPVVISPFYGIGDLYSKVLFNQGLIKVSCSYIAEDHPNSIVETTDLILTQIRFGQNLKDNRIQLNYSGNTGDFFCGAVANMTEIWLIDHSPCCISLYGCHMAQINGKLQKFEGVIILRDRMSTFSNKCSNDALQYTYDVLQNQVGIELHFLANSTSTNHFGKAGNYCQIERARHNFCKTFRSDNFHKRINSIFFVVLTVGLGIIFFYYLCVKYIG